MFEYLLIRALRKLPRSLGRTLVIGLLIPILAIFGLFFVSCTYYVINPPQPQSVYPATSDR